MTKWQKFNGALSIAVIGLWAYYACLQTQSVLGLPAWVNYVATFGLWIIISFEVWKGNKL